MVRRTAKGVWLRVGGPEVIGRYTDLRDIDLKFVLAGEGKRWAYPTREAALDSFTARKRRQIKILEGQLHRARQALRVAENGGAEVPPWLSAPARPAC